MPGNAGSNEASARKPPPSSPRGGNTNIEINTSCTRDAYHPLPFIHHSLVALPTWFARIAANSTLTLSLRAPFLPLARGRLEKNHFRPYLAAIPPEPSAATPESFLFITSCELVVVSQCPPASICFKREQAAPSFCRLYFSQDGFWIWWRCRVCAGRIRP